MRFLQQPAPVCTILVQLLFHTRGISRRSSMREAQGV
jgi:hypothetical protein